MTVHRFVVVGYNDDEQQPIWEVIDVEGETREERREKAEEKFGEIHGSYADVVDVFTPEGLMKLAASVWLDWMVDTGRVAEGFRLVGDARIR